MKMNLMITALAFAVLAVIAEGCASNNNSSADNTIAATPAAATSNVIYQNTPTPSPATQAATSTPNPTPYPTANPTGRPSPTTHPVYPSDSQQSQAKTIAESNATISNALASGYTFQGVSFYDYSRPDNVYVQYTGGNEIEMDEYLVFVDLDKNEITNITLLRKPLMPTDT